VRVVVGLLAIGALLGTGFLILHESDDGNGPIDRLEAVMKERCEELHGDWTRTDDALDEYFRRLLREDHGDAFAAAVERDASSMSVLGCMVGGPVAHAFFFSDRSTMLRTARLHEGSPTCVLDEEFFDALAPLKTLCMQVGGTVIEPQAETAKEPRFAIERADCAPPFSPGERRVCRDLR
jgi:hypothetical protein